ncbi:MAG: ACP phosphodiesterase [Planctomycetes bacterium]|nr:ACP phosphodiesterase [Planctomycetota bacterium]
MNWLAHLRLSPPAPLLRLGNLAADFVQGVDLATLHPELQRGIAMHRAVDRFVDAHPLVDSARARVPPPLRRFAGVLIDVYCDHFLARDWDRLGAGQPLDAFLGEVHAALRTHHELLPPALQRVAPRLCADGWIEGYAQLDGLERVFGLMAARRARIAPLAAGAEPLRRHYDAFAADFAALWPQLLEHTARVGADRAPPLSGACRPAMP